MQKAGFLTTRLKCIVSYRDDAIKAKDAVTRIDGRTVYVDYADVSHKKTKSEKLEDRLRRIQHTGTVTAGREEEGGGDEMNDGDDDDHGDDGDGSDGEEEENQETIGKKNIVRGRNTEHTGKVL